MSLDTVFKGANALAMAGWLALALAPLLPRWSDRLAGFAIPLILAVLYAGLVLAFWSRAEGGFGSLDEVMRLLSGREIALAGWLHYLAFDLFVGAWAARTARAEGLPHALLVPCLGLIFLFGPAGFLAFVALRLARSSRLALPRREDA